MDARVHILLARKSAMAVAIRRGPSKRVCTVGWDRERDVFTLGQWFKGHIYERRCDLSADGKWLICFALNGKERYEAKGAWTAISKAPYLKALVLWAKGDTWGGGGLFTGLTSYWIEGGPVGVPSIMAHQLIRDDPQFVRDEASSVGRWVRGGPDVVIYYNRLERDGWAFVGATDPHVDPRVFVFEKALPFGMKLRKRATHGHSGLGHGCYYDTHELVSREGSAVPLLEAAEWAEYDGKRVMWVERGILKVAEPIDGGVANERQLYDFNPMTFENIKAPY